MQRLHNARALRPTAARARRQRDDRNLAASQRIHPQRAPLSFLLRIRSRATRCINDILRSHILDHRARGQAILRKADAPVLQVSANLFVLRPIKSVSVEQRRERLVVRRFILAARQQRVEQRLHHPAQLRLRPARRAETIQLRTTQRRERTHLLSKKRRHRQRVVARRHQGIRAIDQIRERAVLVDRKVVNHRLHRERQRVLQLAFRRGHDLLQPPLRFRLPLRREDESHAAARHAAEHPEAPKAGAELRANLFDQGLRVVRARPRNDRLDRTLEILRRHRAHRPDVASAERAENLVENAERLAATFPLGFRAQQILLRHHLQNRTDILRHAAVNEHETLLQLASRFRRGIRSIEHTMARHQATAADAEFRIALAGRDAFNELHPGPHTAAVLPATARTAKPFAQQRTRQHETPLAFLQRPGERRRLPGRAHGDADERGEKVRGNREP